MNKKWNVWIYPVGCILVTLFLLIFVLVSNGCATQSSSKNGTGTTQAYASEAAPDSKQIFVCSHLSHDRKFQGEGVLDFTEYSSVIWVEPVTQNVFSVYYATASDSGHYARAISGPLSQKGNTKQGGTPVYFDDYRAKAEKAGYSFIFED